MLIGKLVVDRQGVLGIFLREPLLEWQREARGMKASSAAYASLKIKLAKRRLAGAHPSDVTVAELEAKHGGKPYWKALVAIVEGDSKINKRACFPHKRGLAAEEGVGSAERGEDDVEGSVLSVEDQVLCLLDQAMDPNVLGRTWWGWRPWL